MPWKKVPETMKAVVNMRSGDVLSCGVQEVPTPMVSDPNDIIIKIEASPINPSDLGRIALVSRFAGSPEMVKAGSTPGTVEAPLPEQAKANFEDGVPMVVGNEGCGTVVAAGESPEAQALMGKRVAVSTGSAWAQYSKFTLGKDALANFAVLPDDVEPLDGASVFVNPLTVVGFVHTMRVEGHEAIVHTAAGSQLGRMLVKYCKKEGVPLVNIVRSEEAVDALKALGADYVVNSSVDTYKADLLAAVKATGATLGFDATGGGELACDILTAFEQALRENKDVEVHPAYGPAKFRQVYRYGGLNPTDTKMPISLGVGNWAYGGWLMPFHFQKHGPARLKKAIEVIVSDLKDTFSTAYDKHLTLNNFAASPEQYFAALQSSTGKKFLVIPNGVL